MVHLPLSSDDMASHRVVPSTNVSICAQSSKMSNKLFSTLFQVDSQPGKLPPALGKVKVDLEQKGNFDSLDDVQLDHILKFIDSEHYSKATAFLNGQSGIFCKCRIPSGDSQSKPKEGLGCQSNQAVKPLSSAKDNANQPSKLKCTPNKALISMSKDEELAALEFMLREMDNRFQYDFAHLGLGETSVERFLAKFKNVVPRFGKAKVKGKMFRLARKARKGAARHCWSRLLLRARIYHQFFVNRLFNSANCIITCWLFCFCASLFN